MLCGVWWFVVVVVEVDCIGVVVCMVMIVFEM